MRERAPAWQAESVTFRHPGATRAAVAAVSCTIRSGGITAILGPNGAGKSTFAKLLLGLLTPTGGTVRYRDTITTAWPRQAMAREVGFVPQGEESVFPLTVREVVEMGRYPHLGLWRTEDANDRRYIAEALHEVEAADLAERRFETLSGGERQRVRIARALAQHGTALVLDEPTAGLDIRHEVELFALLRRLAADGHTIVLVTHNLGLAARLVDEVLLFADGRLASQGPPSTVLTSATLSAVYGWPVDVMMHPGPGPDRGTPIVLPRLTVGASIP